MDGSRRQLDRHPLDQLLVRSDHPVFHIDLERGVRAAALPGRVVLLGGDVGVRVDQYFYE